MIEKEESYQFQTVKWLEKSREWNQALKIYNKKLINNQHGAISPFDQLENQLGKLRCLKNLFDWTNLSKMVGQMWDTELENIQM